MGRSRRRSPTSRSQSAKPDVDAAAASLLSFRADSTQEPLASSEKDDKAPSKRDSSGSKMSSRTAAKRSARTLPSNAAAATPEGYRPPTRARGGPPKRGRSARGSLQESENEWTTQDDAELRKGVAALGKKSQWQKIASTYLDDKFTSSECLQRFQYISAPGGVKGSWTEDEDNVIIREVQACGRTVPPWAQIASRLPGRIGKQCRERWVNHLNPNLKRTPFTKEEDERLYRLHNELGNKWAVIAQNLPGRSDNAVKNRWYSQFVARGLAHKTNEDSEDTAFARKGKIKPEVTGKEPEQTSAKFSSKSTKKRSRDKGAGGKSSKRARGNRSSTNAKEDEDVTIGETCETDKIYEHCKELPSTVAAAQVVAGMAMANHSMTDISSCYTKSLSTSGVATSSPEPKFEELSKQSEPISNKTNVLDTPQSVGYSNVPSAMEEGGGYYSHTSGTDTSIPSEVMDYMTPLMLALTDSQFRNQSHSSDVHFGQYLGLFGNSPQKHHGLHTSTGSNSSLSSNGINSTSRAVFTRVN